MDILRDKDTTFVFSKNGKFKDTFVEMVIYLRDE